VNCVRPCARYVFMHAHHLSTYRFKNLWICPVEGKEKGVLLTVNEMFTIVQARVYERSHQYD